MLTTRQLINITVEGVEYLPRNISTYPDFMIIIQTKYRQENMVSHKSMVSRVMESRRGFKRTQKDSKVLVSSL